MTWKKSAVNGISAIALMLGTSGGARAANLVVNGGFETTTNGAGQFDAYTTAPGWTSAGYNFIFAPGSADTTGSYTPEFSTNLTLWGPNNGSVNGLPATSPDGGNFVGADGAFESGPISQTINGLVAGNQYAVSFYWAGAQQHGFDGDNTEKWQVSLGADTQSTSVYSNPSHGFSGWKAETFIFTASGPSELLSFLAIGTPISPSVPPFSLLDGVSVSAVPEPSSLLLSGISLFGLGAVHVRRRLKSATV